MEKVNRNKPRMTNPFEHKTVHLISEDLRKTMHEKPRKESKKEDRKGKK